MDFDYSIVTTEPELNDLCLALQSCPRNDEMNPLVLDVETYNPFAGIPSKGIKIPPHHEANDRFTAFIAGMSLSWGEDKAAYIPLAHTDGNNLHFDRVVENVEVELFNRLLPYLTQWEWCNHLERFDWGIFKQRNVFVNYRYCTYVEAMLTGKYFDLLKTGKDNAGEGYSDSGLKSLILREFGYQMRSMDDLAAFADGYHIERVPAETAAWYACDDANWDRKLHRLLYPQVKDLFLWKVEMAVSHLTEIMEENGIPFRPEPCLVQMQRLNSFIPIAQEVIFSQIERQLGHRLSFNIGNPNDVRRVLFDLPPKGLGLPIQKTSHKTGKPSTDAKTLDKMSKDFEVVHNILTYRKICKSDDSFLSTLPTYIHPITKKIHSTFHQGGVPAGRYASSDPNAQNWSDEKEYVIKDSGVGFHREEIDKQFEVREDGKWIVLVLNVRDACEVDVDEILVSADFKQAEFWGALELAGEVGMLSLIAQGYDPHDATASLMYQAPIDNVPTVLRKKAKTRNFAMLYGETDAGFAYKEGLTLVEVAELRLKHERAIARVIAHRQNVIGEARRNHFVTTHFGRHVDLSQMYDHPDRTVQEKADRLAYNALMQGSFTGDMPKIAMVRCMTMLRSDYPNYPGSYEAVHIPLIHNGHDSLMFRLTPKVRGDATTIDLPGFVAKITAAMEIQIPGFRLPARIDVKVGRRYGTMFPYKGESAGEILAQLNNSEGERNAAQAVALSVNGFNGNGHKATMLRLQMQGPPTSEQAVALKGLLLQYPGPNVVAMSFISTEGKPEQILIGKYPTSLGIRDADKFGMILPCTVLAESADEHMDYMAAAMEQVQ